MQNEYIIVNKTALLKMRKELKKEYANWDGRIYNSDYHKGQVDLIDAIIPSQSTPLIPEIEKAIQFGALMDKRMGYINKQVKDYVTNLKLDI